MKLIKHLAIGMISLMVIFAGIIFINLYNTDINKYRESISAELSEFTGHTVEIKGELQWTWWPDFGFEAHDVTISDKSGKEAIKLSHINDIQAHVKYPPLIQGKIVIKKLEVTSAFFHLPWPKRSYHRKYPISYHEAMKDRAKIRRNIDIEAINFQDITLYAKQSKVHLRKIQAINANLDEIPFPFFIEIYINKDKYKNHISSYDKPFRVYDGRVKGMMRIKAARSPLEQAGYISFDGELKANEVRIINGFINNLQGAVQFNHGVVIAKKLTADVGDGKLEASAMVDFLTNTIEFSANGKNIDTTKVEKIAPTLVSGTANIEISGKTLFGNGLPYYENTTGQFSWFLKNGMIKRFSVNKIIFHANHFIEEIEKADSAQAREKIIKEFSSVQLLANHHDFIFRSSDMRVTIDKANIYVHSANIISPPYHLTFKGNVKAGGQQIRSFSVTGQIAINTDGFDSSIPKFILKNKVIPFVVTQKNHQLMAVLDTKALYQAYLLEKPLKAPNPTPAVDEEQNNGS